MLKCSHTFNALDCRGAIGVTERQVFYGQMREMARRVAERYLEQRKELEYPLMKESGEQKVGNGQPGKTGLLSDLYSPIPSSRNRRRRTAGLGPGLGHRAIENLRPQAIG